MPRPGRMRATEKSKDFKGSIKRLLSNLRPWKVLMILALTLAMISAILSLVAPDKLSELTDTITEGIAPDHEKFELIGIEISNNFSEENLQDKMSSLFIEVKLTEEDMQKIENFSIFCNRSGF